MKTIEGADPVEVVWSRTPAGAPVYGARSSFRSRNWCNPHDNDGIGEQYDPETCCGTEGDRWYSGRAPAGLVNGPTPCGSATVAYTGAGPGDPTFMTLGDGSAPCCSGQDVVTVAPALRLQVERGELERAVEVRPALRLQVERGELEQAAEVRIGLRLENNQTSPPDPYCGCGGLGPQLCLRWITFDEGCQGWAVLTWDPTYINPSATLGAYVGTGRVSCTDAVFTALVWCADVGPWNFFMSGGADSTWNGALTSCSPFLISQVIANSIPGYMDPNSNLTISELGEEGCNPPCCPPLYANYYGYFRVDLTGQECGFPQVSPPMYSEDGCIYSTVDMPDDWAAVLDISELPPVLSIFHAGVLQAVYVGPDDVCEEGGLFEKTDNPGACDWPDTLVVSGRFY